MAGHLEVACGPSLRAVGIIANRHNHCGICAFVCRWLTRRGRTLSVPSDLVGPGSRQVADLTGRLRMAVIAPFGLPAGDAAVVIAVFVVIAISTVLAPVVVYRVAGQQARHIPDDMRAWLARENAVVMGGCW